METETMRQAAEWSEAMTFAVKTVLIGGLVGLMVWRPLAKMEVWLMEKLESGEDK